MHVAIVVVGNELLSGHTPDANGPYLAGQLRELGHRVRRITIVPDEMREIVAALTDDAGRAELVFACGGLGPTSDDLTIDAVAQVLHRPLEQPEEAREQVRRIYRLGRERGYLKTDEVDEEAWRMSRIPHGGIVVRNDAGVAPGSVHTFTVKRGAGMLFVLPGPPRELQSVFRNMLDAGLVPKGEALVTGEVHLKTFEAPVARALAEIAAKFPELTFGSYPQQGEMRVIIRFSGDEQNVKEALAEVRRVLGHLEILRAPRPAPAPGPGDDDERRRKGVVG